MATQLPPSQQDFTAGPEDEDGMMFDLGPDEISDVEEQSDGSAIVRMEDIAGPMEEEDFYGNLTNQIRDFELGSLGMQYLDLIDKDKQAREDRDKQYEEGLKRTGLGHDAPGGAMFQGASKVVHPIMAEACIDFESRAIKELFPPDGPVRTNVKGEADEEATARADRKRDFMNWQLTDQIVEFRDEEEQMLTQLPLGGSQYLKLWYDERKKRPCAEFVPIDNVILPFSAGNFYTAQRVTEVHYITQQEFESRVKAGMYRDVDIGFASMEPETTGPSKANDKIEGRRWQDNEDGLRRVYHIYVDMAQESDKYSGGEVAPYILMVDENSSEVLGLYRNWEEGDKTMTKLDWLVEFKFIPWRGAYAIGFPHLIGGLSAALTGALRALLDTAHINNSATMIKLKGAKFSGQSQNIEVTQVTEVEAAPGVDDIRKVAMPMPFNPPNPVLFQLLGWLTDAAKGVVTTSEEKIADVNSNAPVGTTQALIEQGAAVFSAIHARLHDSQKRVLKVLSRINRWYLDDMHIHDAVSDLEIHREDFTKNDDVIPVSDPHIFSETQRMAQTQAVIALMDKYPDNFDKRAVIERTLRQMKIPNLNELMPAATEPQEINAAAENAAMALGRNAFAYPNQNHLAHIQSHLDFALDPMLGSNPMMASDCLPKELDHIKQHITLWYIQQMDGYVQHSLGKPIGQYADTPLTGEIDKLYAVASQHTKLDVQQAFAKVGPAIAQLQQIMQQNSPKPPMSADDQVLLQTSMAETQRKTAKDQADQQLAQQKLQVTSTLEAHKIDKKQELESNRLQSQALEKNRAQQIEIALNANNNLTEERIKSAELTHDAEVLQHEQQKTALTALQGAEHTLGGQHGTTGTGSNE